MPPNELHLSVIWPGGRKAAVLVEVEEPLADLDAPDGAQAFPAPRALYGIGPGALDSEDALMKFLEGITRTEDPSAIVRVVCLAPRLPKLLKLLKVAYPVPNPIVVELR